MNFSALLFAPAPVSLHRMLSIAGSNFARCFTGSFRKNFLTLGLALATLRLQAAEQQVAAPDGGLVVTVSDVGGLNYRVEAGGKLVVTNSPLGLEFKDGARLGPAATIKKVAKDKHRGTWENHFGNRRDVPDEWREARLTLEEPGSPARTFGVIVRVFNDGVAFRYDLPEKSGLGKFVLTDELTEFRFAGDYRCWGGRDGASTEVQYPQTTLSALFNARGGRPARSVLPLLVETPAGFFAVAESDVIDWAGMSLVSSGATSVKPALDRRSDGNGLVVSTAPRVSPWRVLIFGRTAAELANSDVIATLASPSRIKDISWIKPGASAWDAWWSGVNPYDSDPRHRAVDARGTTPSTKEYIDLAAEMGWPYQLMDWYWYENMTSYNKSLHSRPNANPGDFTKPVPEINVPELMKYARSKNVRLLIWAHSLDVETYGVEKSLAYFASQGFAGVKIDFINSQSQETVKWCEDVLATAAKYHLLIDFHGTYKPTGLARTYPNFITQEGVLGNEYDKLGGNQCTPLHMATLPFTRALLGPMDFTPGGFLNRAPKDFRTTAPAEVMGTRARQLALCVLYPSPLLILCDSPQNYRGQAGIEFLHAIPTVWDETVILNGEVGKSIVMARRSGQKWYLTAINGDDAAQLPISLSFLGKGKWQLHNFADKADGSDYQAVIESKENVTAKSNTVLSLAPAGGFAGILTRAE